MEIHEKIAHKLFRRHGYNGEKWLMSFAEKIAIAEILSLRRPQVSIEIGSYEGGSLSIASHYSDEVISIDLNPAVKNKLEGKFSNVEFLTGYSHVLLPQVIDKLNTEGKELGYVLIDGDHTADFVRKDILEVLRYKPRSEMWIVMHDSFNAACREGIKSVNWRDYANVHWINFDFIPGFLNSVPGCEDQLWGGLAIAYLEQTLRTGELKFGEMLGRQFEKLFPLSVIPESQR